MDKIRETKRKLRLKAWSEMYRQYRESGRTVSEWCKKQGISPKTFYYRLRKIRETALAVKEKHEIVPVQKPVITAKQDSQESIKISSRTAAEYFARTRACSH